MHIWIKEDDQPETPKEDDQPETLPSQEEVSALDSEGRALLSAIERLPDLYRMVVALRMVKGMGYADIAQVLDRPEGTLKAQYHRGKQLLVNLQKNDTEKEQAEAKAAAELQAKLAYKDHLPRHWRQAVELYYLQNLDVKEITKRLGKPESTIRRWIKCAMEYLQNCEASTCPERATETSRRKHKLASEKHYQEIRHVSPAYRREIELFYTQASSIADIAEQRKISKPAVKMRLHRGRAQLKQNTGEEAV